MDSGRTPVTNEPAGCVAMEDWEVLMGAVKHRLAQLAQSAQEHPQAECLADCAAALRQLHATLLRERDRAS